MIPELTLFYGTAKACTFRLTEQPPYDKGIKTAEDYGKIELIPHDMVLCDVVRGCLPRFKKTKMGIIAPTGDVKFPWGAATFNDLVHVAKQFPEPWKYAVASAPPQPTGAKLDDGRLY